MVLDLRALEVNKLASHAPYEILETPREVRGLIYPTDDDSFDPHDISDEADLVADLVYKALGVDGGCNSLRGRRFVYPPDMMDGPGMTKELLQSYMANAHMARRRLDVAYKHEILSVYKAVESIVMEVRGLVEGAITRAGGDIVVFDQPGTNFLKYHLGDSLGIRRVRTTRWRKLSNNPDVVCKWSSVDCANGDTDLLRKLNTLSHPNLAPEKFLYRENERVFMIAPRLKYLTLRRVLRSIGEEDLELLYENDLLPLSVVMGLIGGMRGCAYLHDEGLIHGDFAPKNIFFTPENNLLGDGMLFDLEGVMEIELEAGKSGLNTHRYNENYIYGRTKGADVKNREYPNDAKRDVLSAGMSLFEVLGGILNRSLVRFDPYDDSSELWETMVDGFRSEHGDNLSKWIDLAANLTNPDRDKRPSMAAAAKVMEQFLLHDAARFNAAVALLEQELGGKEKVPQRLGHQLQAFEDYGIVV